MFKIGLKLWSTNTDHYLREAKRLYAEGGVDYIELYCVPGSLDHMNEWKSLDIPFVVHAPHSAHGVNLADRGLEEQNSNTFSEVKAFADGLNATTIIVHGGVLGSVDEIIRQINLIGDPRMAIENKPYYPIDDSHRLLAGSTPEEIGKIIKATGCGFCFDVGHAVASANAHGVEWKDWFESFMEFKPKMFHLSDIDLTSKKDQHLHFGTGTLPLKEITALFPRDAVVSVETEKCSRDDLDDFKEDAQWLRNLN